MKFQNGWTWKFLPGAVFIPHSENELRVFLFETEQLLHLSDGVMKTTLYASWEKLGHFQSYYFYYVLSGILVLQQYILYINSVSFFFDVYAFNAEVWFEVTYNQLTWRLLVKNKMFKNNLTQFCWIAEKNRQDGTKRFYVTCKKLTRRQLLRILTSRASIQAISWLLV